MTSALPTVFILIGLCAAYVLSCHGGGQLPRRSSSGNTGGSSTTSDEKKDALLKKADAQKGDLKGIPSKLLLAEALDISLAELEELHAYARKVQNKDFVDLYEMVVATEARLLPELNKVKNYFMANLGKDEVLKEGSSVEALAEILGVKAEDMEKLASLAKSRKEADVFVDVYGAVAKNEKEREN